MEDNIYRYLDDATEKELNSLVYKNGLVVLDRIRAMVHDSSVGRRTEINSKQGWISIDGYRFKVPKEFSLVWYPRAIWFCPKCGTHMEIEISNIYDLAKFIFYQSRSLCITCESKSLRVAIARRLLGNKFIIRRI